MALVACKECGSNVSSTAFKCPNCGVQLIKPKRGFWGKLFKWTFILFNIGMLFWLISYFASVGEITSSANSDAEKAGAAIGATIGTGMLVAFWGFGDVILGLLVLLTRPKSS